MKNKFKIKGMTCSACQSHLQSSISKEKGITNCNVNLLTNSMDVDFDDNITDVNKIKKAVKKAGYEAFLEGEQVTIPKSNKNNFTMLLTTIILALILFYIAMGPMIYLSTLPIFNNNPLILGLTELLIVIPIIIINRSYYVNGFRRLFKLSPNMDSLIAIGSSASLIYGIYIIYVMAYKLNLGQDITHYAHELYIESAGTILALVSLGKYLENRSKNKTTDAISKLMTLIPKTAIIKTEDGESEVPIENVKVDDLIIIKNGMQVPVDGIIVEGTASIDQSNITGESIPVFKQVNEEVISSTILTSGYIIIKATKVGKDTAINKIIELVEEAANSKAPISKLADKISFYFVPAVLLIAIISFITFCFLESFSFAFSIAICVLVIACPCALGLATPVAIMVSTGVAAKNGLIIKNAEILEKTHNLKTCLLDKTGTITMGKPEVIDIINFSNEDILGIAYSLELKSEHPLAKAVISKANDLNISSLNVVNFKTYTGKGISGYINNKIYFIGNEAFLKENNIINNQQELIFKLANEGKTPLLISNSQEIIGIITIKDPIKKDSKVAISKLKKLGLNIVMITGDNKLTAKAIANEVGINEVYSDVLPNEKQNIVTKYKEENQHVAMIGDGVNDAPSLVTADIGIAIGSGSDIAIDSADIVLVSNSLLDVYYAINLSKKTINNIKLNLFWAFFYNIIGILLASGMFYYLWNLKLTPTISALAMSFSSVFVVTNVLRLNLFKKEKRKKEKEKMETITLKIENMMCKHCVMHVEKALTNIPGVSSVIVSLENKNAIITGNNLNKSQLIQAIVDAGYEVVE